MLTIQNSLGRAFLPDTLREKVVIFLPTTKKTELDFGFASVSTLAQHSTVVFLTAWKFRTLLELKESPSAMLVVLYRLLFTASPLRVQPTVGMGNQADVTHWNSTCWSCNTVTLPPMMLTVPLSEKYRQRQRRVLRRILTQLSA